MRLARNFLSILIIPGVCVMAQRISSQAPVQAKAAETTQRRTGIDKTPQKLRPDCALPFAIRPQPTVIKRRPNLSLFQS
jgi:hypothetical protein